MGLRGEICITRTVNFVTHFWGRGNWNGHNIETIWARTTNYHQIVPLENFFQITWKIKLGQNSSQERSKGDEYTIRYDTIREKSLAWAPQKLSDQLNLAYVAKKWKEETKTNKSKTWWLWWGDMRRMRWNRRRLDTMRLTEWRRELIPQVRWCIY